MAKEFMPLKKTKTVADMRQESQQLKAQAAKKKTPIKNERPPTNITKPPATPKAPKGNKASQPSKPLTNTSGTATEKKGSAWFDAMVKSVKFGAKAAGTAGVMAAALGVPVRKGSMVINPKEQSILPVGTVLPAKVREMESTPKVEKPPTDTGGSGIDAPAPDTGWRPSGTNSASGLQQKTMGVPLQEQIGVTKRKR